MVCKLKYNFQIFFIIFVISIIKKWQICRKHNIQFRAMKAMKHEKKRIIIVQSAIFIIWLIFNIFQKCWIYSIYKSIYKVIDGIVLSFTNCSFYWKYVGYFCFLTFFFVCVVVAVLALQQFERIDVEVIMTEKAYKSILHFYLISIQKIIPKPTIG